MPILLADNPTELYVVGVNGNRDTPNESNWNGPVMTYNSTSGLYEVDITPDTDGNVSFKIFDAKIKYFQLP